MAGAGHETTGVLMANNIGVALTVAAVHVVAMAAGAILAVGIYLWLGLKFLSRGWFNLDVVWARSLGAQSALIDGIGIVTAIA